MLLLNFCLRSILWMACVFTSKLQVKLSSQFYSWSSITREETFRNFYWNIPYLNPFRLLTSLNRSLGRDRQHHGESHALKTIEFWHLKVICITSERMLSSWHSPFNLPIIQRLPAIWMSQTSFILDKPVLPVHARIFWSFADSFCAQAP